MEYISDIRTRAVTKQAGTNTSVSYEVLNPTGKAVTVINGTIFKDIPSDSSYISFENFATLTHAERKELLSTVSDHIESILTEPAE